MTLKNGSKLTYDLSSPFYSCNRKEYPLEALKDFCYENKHKVKLENLNRSANLSAEDLKSKLSDYISSQPLEELELVKKKLSSSNSSRICEDLIDLSKNRDAAEELAKLKQVDHCEEHLKRWRDDICPGDKDVESIINLLLANKELTQECLEKVAQHS